MATDRQLLERIKRDVLYGRDIQPPSIDAAKCNGCGICMRACTALVFELSDHQAKIAHGERCYACGHCWALCPEEAVTQSEVITTPSLIVGRMPAVSPDALQLLIRERRSTRLFKSQLVSRDQLVQIIEAGRYGPSGANRQDVHYVVLSSPEEVAQLRSRVDSFMAGTFKLLQNRAAATLMTLKFGRRAVDVLRYYAMGYRFSREAEEKHAYFPLPFAPAAIVVHAQSFDATAQFNCAVALYNCSLMAHSMGLASCFLGFVQIAATMQKPVRDWLGIPKDHGCYGAMAVGVPDVKYRRLVERRSAEITWR